MKIDVLVDESKNRVTKWPRHRGYLFFALNASALAKDEPSATILDASQRKFDLLPICTAPAAAGFFPYLHTILWKWIYQ